MYEDLQFRNKEVILTGTDYIIKTVVICPLIRFIECLMQSPEGVLLEKRSKIFVKIHMKAPTQGSSFNKVADLGGTLRFSQITLIVVWNKISDQIEDDLLENTF